MTWRAISAWSLLLGSKEARWTGTAVMEIEEGKFLKTWINSDSISALIQLGLLQDVVVGQFARQVARTSFSHQRTGSGGGVGPHFTVGTPERFGGGTGYRYEEDTIIEEL